MENLRTRDKVAVVIAILTVIAIVQGETVGALDLIIGVAVNLAIVYGVAALLDFFKSRS
jgi:hypothetical protein